MTSIGGRSKVLSSDDQLWGEVWGYIRDYRWRMVAINCLSPIQSALAALLLFLLKRLFDAGLLTADTAAVYTGIGWMLALFAVQTGVEMAQTLLTVRTFAEIANNVKGRLYRKLLAKDTLPHSNERIGDLMSRFHLDVGSFSNIVGIASYGVARDVITAATLLGAIIYLNWEFSLIALGIYALILYPLIAIGSSVKRLSDEYMGDCGEANQILYDTIYGHIVIRAYGLVRHFVQRYDGANHRMTRNAIRSALIGRLNQPLNDMAVLISICILIYLGIPRIQAGTLSVGGLVVFLLALYKFAEPVKSMAGTYTSYQGSLPAARRLVEILHRPGSDGGSEGRAISAFHHTINFSNVEFRYDQGRIVLHGLDLVISKGDKVVIAGRSGSGKSTFLSLLLGLREPTGGTIFIDGEDYRTLAGDSILSLFAYVSQEPTLFNASVGYNIRIGNLSADDDCVMESCTRAQAAGFIRSLPQGLETTVGERGQRLSGGERQRVTIARSLLRDAPIIILDEATSSIDMETDEEIRKAILEMYADRTIILVTHRPVPEIGFEKAYTLREGTLVPESRFSRRSSSRVAMVSE